MSNQYLSFDVTKQSTPQQLITGRQGDSQLKFVTMLFWDGDKNVPYDLTGKKVAFEALKPDNTHIVDYEGITVLDAPAGLVRYSFNEQVFSVAGTMQQAFFKITHTDSNNNVIADSTLEVAINIVENRAEFGINSKDYLSEYDDLIAKVEKKFDDYAAIVQKSIDEARDLHNVIDTYISLIKNNQVLLYHKTGKATDGTDTGNVLFQNSDGTTSSIYPETEASVVKGLSDAVAEYAPKETIFYDDILYKETWDSETKVPYSVVTIPKTDKNGKAIKLKTGFAYDSFGDHYEVPSSFMTRHKNASVIINSFPWDINKNAVIGRVIKDKVVLRNNVAWGNETLGIKSDGSLKSYPNSIGINDIVNDDVVDAIPGFYPLIVNGVEYNYNQYEAVYPNMNKPNTRQIIAQKSDGTYLIFSFDGRTNSVPGISYSDAVRVMLSYGVSFAYLLDGGGSMSTTVNGTLITRPVDNDRNERPVPGFIYFEKEDSDVVNTSDNGVNYGVSRRANSVYRKVFHSMINDHNELMYPQASQAATFTDFKDVAASLRNYIGTWYTITNTISNGPIPASGTTYSLIEIINFNDNSGLIRFHRYSDNLSWQAGVNDGIITSWDYLTSNSRNLRQIDTLNFNTIASNISKYSGNWMNGLSDMTNVPDSSSGGHFAVIQIMAFNDTAGIITLSRPGDNLSWQAGVNNNKIVSWKQVV